MILISGALLGFISVAFGAFAEHGLQESLTDEQFRFLMTAIRYNQVHAVVVTAIGIALLNGGKLAKIPVFRWSGLLFIFGTMLFSFSIYISVTLEISSLLNITPIGGVTILTAWAFLLVTGAITRPELQSSK
jgi:uncharacterized membrane protein YgdD (TMEM256/DUF423 family)